jgi:tetratricopeptide (TPR) repeat protein
MSFFKSIQSKYRSWNRKRRGLIEDDYVDHTGGQSGSFWRSFMGVVVLPLKMLFVPLRLIGLIQTQDATTSNETEELGFPQRVLFVLKQILSLPFLLLREPIRIFKSLRRARPRDLLFALPAIAILGFFGFVFVQIFAYGEAIDNRYARGAQIATEQKDFELAKTYYQRILGDNNITPRQQYDWAMILAQTGEDEQAYALIEKIAPDDAMGFGPAHKLVAISIARQIEIAKDKALLSKLRHHLVASRDLSPEIEQVWAAYYIATEQRDKAIASLDRAAQKRPSFYITISNLYKQSGQKTESVNALKKAETSFRKTFKKDELEHQNRIAFANVLALLEKFDEAEGLLQQGVRVKPDELIKRSLSDFYAMRYDLARRTQLDPQTQMDFLTKAIEIDPNYSAVYSRMIQLFTEVRESPDQAKKIRSLFEEIVTGDRPTALAHFALSNILWIVDERVQAKFHLEQAYLLDNDFVIIINNLAWILAQEESPDLERALELAETAVSRVPESPRFRDTLGTVLVKLGRHKEAISELQLALSGVPDTAPVHKKLAFCYKSIGMNDLAEMHLEKIRSAASEK